MLLNVQNIIVLILVITAQWGVELTMVPKETQAVLNTLLCATAQQVIA